MNKLRLFHYLTRIGMEHFHETSKFSLKRADTTVWLLELQVAKVWTTW
jgi:hypothetical protein